MVCAAKLSGIREFPKAGIKVFTGCTKHPAHNSKFCAEHKKEPSPVIPAQKVSSRTRAKLREERTSSATYKEAEQDDIYIVESIIQIKDDTKELLIKWSGFPEPTWEPEACVPPYLKLYYQNNPSKLGKQIPNPKIKHTKKIGDTLIHKLCWGDEEGDEWIDDDFFKIVNDHGESVSMLSSCNTRKSRDKRENAHSVGVFVGAYPCGTIVLGDELYGSESISQVYGILTDFVNSLSDSSKLKQLLYDDMCHLKRFCDDEERSNQNEVTQVLARIRKHVDKFHFRNHIDRWCQENCNPDHVKELQGVNSQVCEQLFKKINSHKNCKGMNEPRFSLFFLYQYEIHNLEIEKKTIMTDPRSDERWTNLTITDPTKEKIKTSTEKLSKRKEAHQETVPDTNKPSDCEERVGNIETENSEPSTTMEEIEVAISNLKLKSKFECLECGAQYDREGNLNNHMKVKHQSVKEHVEHLCKECGKLLLTVQSLDRHMRTHKDCKKCQKIFDTVEDAKNHKKVHTTCPICNYDYKTQIKRHMKDVHCMT